MIRIILLLPILFFALLARADLPVTSISFTTIDADTDIEILSNIEIDGQKLKGKNYILPKNSDSHISLTVNVDAGKDYGYRSFNIFLEGIKKNKSTLYHLHGEEGQGRSPLH